MKKIFANISNHPKTIWSEKQIEAVKLLDYTEIVDFIPPIIDPDASTAQVFEEAQKIVNAIKQDNEICGAFVAGDYTLTYQLVELLEAQNIKCFAATTKRSCQEIKLDNGQTEIKRIFEFVQWRAYIPCN